MGIVKVSADTVAGATTSWASRSAGSIVNDKLLDRIESALERDVRPALREEGGDVELVGVDADRIVQIRLLGSCQGCSGAAIVLTSEIEAKLKASMPEICFLEPVP